MARRTERLGSAGQTDSRAEHAWPEFERDARPASAQPQGQRVGAGSVVVAVSARNPLLVPETRSRVLEQFSLVSLASSGRSAINKRGVACLTNQ